MASFLIEYYWQILPCKLCWIQRGLYGTLSIVALGGFLFSFVRSARSLCIAMLLALLITSIYHTLIQFNLLTAQCSTRISVENFESFSSQLGSLSRTCSQQNWFFLGMPLSLWNVIVSSALLILFLISLQPRIAAKIK